MTLRGTLALLGLLVASIGMAQRTLPNIPKNHWVFADLRRLKKDGLLVGYPDGLSGYHPRTRSRYELAAGVHVCYSNMRSVAKGVEKHAKRLGSMPFSAESGRAYKD